MVVVNDYYKNKDKVKDTVVVLGGGLAGCECAVHLAREGKRVHLVEMRDVLAPDCNIRHRPILMKKVDELVTVHLGHAGVEVTAEGLLCKASDGSQVLIPGQTVICAVASGPTGRTPRPYTLPPPSSGRWATASARRILPKRCMRGITLHWIFDCAFVHLPSRPII